MNRITALKKSLSWFLSSGVMPENGKSGVAERLALTKGNSALDEIKNTFPNHTCKADFLIVENRRADCCFETALLFLLAGDLLDEPSYRKTGENILEFLFEKSDLRHGELWNWYTPWDKKVFWFDDNGWVAAIEIFLGRRYPELDKKYNLQELGTGAALRLGKSMLRTLDSSAPVKHGLWPDTEFAGEARQPHWGTPVCAALLLAGEFEMVREYHKRGMAEFWYKFGLSEWVYAFLSSALGGNLGDEFLKARSLEIYHYLKQHEIDGILPSEHCEAPCGKQLADLIYTQNWYLPALGLLPEAKADFERLRDFMISIQNPDGSWQGMYDISLCRWAGGDRYEGGANSIYTGWTNTVIALAMLM